MKTSLDYISLKNWILGWAENSPPSFRMDTLKEKDFLTEYNLLSANGYTVGINASNNREFIRFSKLVTKITRSDKKKSIVRDSFILIRKTTDNWFDLQFLSMDVTLIPNLGWFYTPYDGVPFGEHIRDVLELYSRGKFYLGTNTLYQIVEAGIIGRSTYPLIDLWPDKE